jgi:hypothetical protein
MYLNHFPLLSLLPFPQLVTTALPSIHYTISRRGGSFPTADTANLTYLLEHLKIIETRFTATTRDFNGNQVIRKPKHKHGTQANTILLGEVGREGNWFANLHLGDPPQNVDMDLDMLTADWWIFSTSSDKGSFLDFKSKSYGTQPLLNMFAGLVLIKINSRFRVTTALSYLPCPYRYPPSPYDQTISTHHLRKLQTGSTMATNPSSFWSIPWSGALNISEPAQDSFPDGTTDGGRGD